MSLLSVVSSEQMQAARVVTGLTMAAFIAIGFVPALGRRVRTIRLLLVLAYLLVCGGFVAYALLR